MYLSPLPAPAAHPVVIEGDEARHALRVKRAAVGDRVALLDGAGGIAHAAIVADRVEGRHGWAIALQVERTEQAPPVHPALHVYSATPKGGRLDDMIDGLSQAGAASWTPLRTHLGVVDPRETKLDRVTRVAVEASKQCGRAWLLSVGQSQSLEQAITTADAAVVMADASGDPYAPTGAGAIRLLIGPEGGWTDAELDLARRHSARITSFGPHTMRIETAAVVATGVTLAHEQNR